MIPKDPGEVWATTISCSGYLSDKKRVKKPFIVFSSISIAICMFCYSYSESIIYVIIIPVIIEDA